MTTAKPPARYRAIWGARPGGFALPSYTTTGDTTAPVGQNGPIIARYWSLSDSGKFETPGITRGFFPPGGPPPRTKGCWLSSSFRSTR